MKEYEVVKTVSGEMVVGHYDDLYQGYLKDCFTIMMMPSSNGQMGMQLVPFMMPFTQDGTTLADRYLITDSRMSAPEQVKSAYIQATSGLVIPKGNIQL